MNSKELKLKFFVNEKEIPINGAPRFVSTGDNTWEIVMQVGTTKLDNIKIKFLEVEYTEELKPKVTKKT